MLFPSYLPSCQPPAFHPIMTEEKSKPRITVPHRMMKKIEKIKMRHAAKRHQQSSVYKGIARLTSIIGCSFFLLVT